MKDIERKVYSSYAFSENAREKMRINQEIFEELKSKWVIYRSTSSCGAEAKLLDDCDLVYKRKAGYGYWEYEILKNETDLSDDELALIFDCGNLYFGYTKKSDNFFRVFRIMEMADGELKKHIPNPRRHFKRGEYHTRRNRH